MQLELQIAFVNTSKPTTCIGCGRILEEHVYHYSDPARPPRVIPAAPYTMIDGDPICDGCNPYRSAPYTAMMTPTEEEYEDREAAPFSSGDIRAAWNEQVHVYIPPGSHGGGSKSKRFGRKTSGGKKYTDEPWVGSR